MDLHQFYKDHYFFEINRKHQLISALAIPVGVLTVIVGAIVVIANDLTDPIDILEKSQLTLIFLCAISSCITIIFLIRSYFNYSYGYIATSQELKEYYEKLLEYLGDKNKADIKLEEYINSEYAKYTKINTANNDQKSGLLHKATGCLIASLIFVALAGIPFVAKSIISEPDAQKIEIVKFPQSLEATINQPTNEEQQMIGDEDEQEQGTEQQTTTQQQEEEPAPPPGRVIKENSEEGNEE